VSQANQCNCKWIGIGIVFYLKINTIPFDAATIAYSFVPESTA